MVSFIINFDVLKHGTYSEYCCARVASFLSATKVGHQWRMETMTATTTLTSASITNFVSLLVDSIKFFLCGKASDAATSSIPLDDVLVSHCLRPKVRCLWTCRCKVKVKSKIRKINAIKTQNEGMNKCHVG